MNLFSRPKLNSPDFLIVGAQKAATTSLHHYLSKHPQLHGSSPKEIRYFDRDENYKMGNNWYLKHFKYSEKKLFGKTLFFESTPEYLYKPYVPGRIFKFKSQIKIIISLREPISRAYSAWNMYKNFTTREKGIPDVVYNSYYKNIPNNLYKELYSKGSFPSFHEIIIEDIKRFEMDSEQIEPSFVRRGVYLPQIQRYVDLFGSENVYIVGFNELRKNPKMALNGILNFLKIKDFSWRINSLDIKNKLLYQDEMQSGTREILESFFDSINKELFDYLGKEIDW